MLKNAFFSIFFCSARKFQNCLEKRIFNIFAWEQNMTYFKHIFTQNLFLKLFACIACEKSSKFDILRFCEFQLFRARCVHFFQKNLFCTPFWIHNFFFIPEYPVFYCIAQPEPNCTFGSDCLIIKQFFLILRTFWHIFQNSGQRVNFKIIFRSEF